MDSPETVATLREFKERTKNYPPENGWIFRGQSDISWPVKPKAGRLKYYVKGGIESRKKSQVQGDLERFEIWRERISNIFTQLPDNHFDCLGYAQHYGLATRLLDWSTDPLIALFFAIEGKNEQENDGAVFFYKPQWQIIDPKKQDPHSPILGCAILRLEATVRYPRIVAQKGLFTYHYNPIVEIDRNELNRISIPAKSKAALLNELMEVGICRATLFPDMEKIAHEVNLETQEIAKREQDEESRIYGI
jgi:hypothetical protein